MSVLLAERGQRGLSLRGDGLDPLSRIQVPMHQHKANRFVDIAAGKDQQKRRMPHAAGQADHRQHHGVHERDFENRAVRRVSGGAGRLDEAYERAWRLVYLCGSCILTDDKAPVEVLGMRVLDELIGDELNYYKDELRTGGLSALIGN